MHNSTRLLMTILFIIELKTYIYTNCDLKTQRNKWEDNNF